MANLLQSSTTAATTAPSYYTDYLSNLASAGTTAQKNAQYVGAQPLQQQAFENVGTAGTAYQPTLEAAGNTLNAATSATSPLAAANPYLNLATQNPAQEASGYVSQYLAPAAQLLSDINQNNINTNLAPGANAGAIGSGQFGSTRNAQVLGQTEALANQQTNSQIEQLLNSGYQSALNAAIQQNQISNQAGSTAASAAGTGQQNLTAAGQAESQLAGQNQALSLADINALSTLGGQQQTIAQNQQNYPLTTLSTLAGLMQGQAIPTSTTNTANMSPLSALGTVGSGTAALFQGTGTNGTGPSLFQQLTGQSSLGGLLSSAGNAINSGLSTLTGNPSITSNQASTIANNNANMDTTQSASQAAGQLSNPYASNSPIQTGVVDNGNGTTTVTYSDGSTSVIDTAAP